MKFARRCAFVVLCLLLLLGAFYAVEDWRGARAWNATVREVRKHGGATDLADIIPPPIPDDQNLAMAPFFVNALHYHIDPETKQLTFGMTEMDPLLKGMPWGEARPGRTHPSTKGDWQQGRPADLRAWQTYFRADPAFPQAPDPQSPAEGVLMALSRYKAPLDEVASAAAARPLSRFPINWTASNPAKIALPQFLLLRNLATALNMRASAEVASGKQAAAVEDIALGFRLSEAINSDPFLIGDLLTSEIVAMMAQPIWDGLAAKSWDADQLMRLQALLSRQDLLAGFAKAMRSEQAFAARMIDYLERRRDDTDMLELVSLPDLMKVSSLDRPLQRFFSMAPKGWYDRNKSRVVNFEEKYMLGAVDPPAHRLFPSTIATGVAEEHKMSVSPYTLFYQMGSSVFEGALVRAGRAQVDCDQAAIACALERYCLDHHSYPGDLAALTADYMSKLPKDVIGGAPMHYQRTADGRYRLYSIGWNARDDGGQVAWTRGPRLDDRNGDWVWQYEPMQIPEFRQN